MGIFKTVGGLVGAAIGGIVTMNPAGAMAGYKAGSTIGGGVDSATKKTGGSSSSTMAAPSTSAFSKAAPMQLKGNIKVAKTYNPLLGKDETKEDPWQLTKEWYDDMGGDSNKVDWDGINL